ncbi:MAG: V-type ATPase subunit [Candidatus Auribacterota bacterium]|jgi:V/A-type H+-transporting ATPase subunit C|nr:V-type ATPase subunit [Candidatus Auribacterota bacterium]
MKNLGLYANINSRIRVKLSRLLTGEQWQSLYKSSDVASLITRLSATRYAPWTQNCTPETFVESIDERIAHTALEDEKKIASQLRGNSSLFVECWAEESDIEYIKQALRAWQKKQPFNPPPSYLISGRYDIPWDIFNPKNSIEEIMLSLMHTPYGKALSAARELYRKTNIVFYLEAALEKDYFKRLAELAESFSGADKSAVIKLLGLQIDMYNINNLLRCKLYFKLPPEQVEHLIYPNGRFFSAEKFFEAYVTRDTGEFLKKISITPLKSTLSANLTAPLQDMALLINHLLKEILFKEIKKMLRGYPFTIGVPLSYIVLNRWEMNQLRSLTWALRLGKKEDIDQVRQENPLLTAQE